MREKTLTCTKCPYKLGVIQTIVNPCPNCKMNGYRALDQFLRHLLGKISAWRGECNES